MQPDFAMPPVVKTLLIINIAVFVVMWLGESMRIPFFMHVIFDRMGRPVAPGPSQFDFWFGLFNPYLIGRFAFWQLITYQFVHGGFFHIFVNMFTLFMIGLLVERQIGSRAFLRLYLIGGIFAGLINVLANIFVNIPTVGASGAICAVVAAFGLMNPNARIGFLVLFIPVFVKARTFVIVYAVLTAFLALGSRDGIAHLAHLGGLVFGWMYVYNIWAVRKLIDGAHPSAGIGTGKSWMNWLGAAWRRFAGRGPRMYKDEEFEDATYKEVRKPRPSGDAGWDSRIDEILDKMSREGIHSLTSEEWEILDKYKKGGR